MIVTADELLLEPTATEPKFTLVGLGLAIGPIPTPDKATVCGLPTALSTMFSPADRAPGAPGVNVTLMVAVVPGATVMGSVPAV